MQSGEESVDIEKYKEKYPKLYAIWDQRPSNDSVDLRNSANKYYVEYNAILQQSILNNVVWMNTREKPIGITDLASGVMKVDDAIVGYDFLMSSPPEMPCMIPRDGAFPFRYAHVLPALMLKNFMKRAGAVNVYSTVLCQGYGYEPSEKWWLGGPTSAADAAGYIVDSEEFKRFIATHVTKKIKRLCVWMFCVGHVFMVLWEQGSAYDAVFFMDNAVGNKKIDDFRNPFLLSFVEKIKPFRSTTVKQFDCLRKSAFSESYVKLDDDLRCVSFMARCTAYLCTLELVVDTEALIFVSCLTDRRYSALCYEKFEKALFEILSYSIIEQKKCVWLPAVMQKKFVNINDIHLFISEANKVSDEDRTRFEFSFGKSSDDVPHFNAVSYDTDAGSICIGEDQAERCTVSTAFFAPTATSVTLLTTGLKECRTALDDAMRLMARPGVLTTITAGEGSFVI